MSSKFATGRVVFDKGPKSLAAFDSLVVYACAAERRRPVQPLDWPLGS